MATKMTAKAALAKRDKVVARLRKTGVQTVMVTIDKPEAVSVAKQVSRHRASSIRRTAERLRALSQENLKPMPTTTPEEHKAAGCAEREGKRQERAATLAAAFADHVEAGTLPELLTQFVPAQAAFYRAAARKARWVDNPPSPYYADGDKWAHDDEISAAVRKLAEGHKPTPPETKPDEPSTKAASKGTTSQPKAATKPTTATGPPPAVRHGNILQRHTPTTLAGIQGHPEAVKSLSAFVQFPCSQAFVFAGPSGIGKTAAANALAKDLGCNSEWGGVVEIPSGMQDGKAVEDVYRKMHLRPMNGSGWKVVVINEADCMTDQAEKMWLDKLEKLPSKTVVVFTTNNLHKMSARFVRRCEVYKFAGDTTEVREAVERIVRHVWTEETGQQIAEMPEGLGKFEKADDNYSIALALQQIAPFIRTGDPLPEKFDVPFIRQERKSPAKAKKGSVR